MKCAFRHYLRSLAIVAGVCLALVAIFNLLIDPYGVFRVLKSARLQSSRITTGTRAYKAEQLRHGDWDVVVVGSSRVECGIDPASPAWGGKKVFNCGLSGMNFSEAAQIVEYLDREIHPRTIVLGLDFFHFHDHARPADEFVHSRFNSDRSLATYYIESLLGETTIKRSFLNLSAACRAPRPPEYDDLGLRIKPMAPPNQSGNAAFNAYLEHAIKSWHDGGGWSGDAKTLQQFRQVLRLAGQKRFTLVLAILPVHALDLELASRQLGSLDAFEQWKRDLVRAIAEEQRSLSESERTVLWDFTGFKGLVADPVPPADDSAPMKWYWEPSHFRRALGDLVIARVQNQSRFEKEDVLEFGVQITAANIESHLRQHRQDRERFAKQASEEVNRIHQRIARPSASSLASK